MSKRKASSVSDTVEAPYQPFTQLDKRARLTIDYPQSWAPEHTDLTKVTFLRLVETSPEYKILDKMFHDQVPRTCAQILCIRECRNPMVWARYATSVMQEMKRISGTNQRAASVLWHGTHVSNAEQICIQNFDKGRMRSNVGSVYGMGVYLTTSAQLACADDYSKPSNHVTIIKDKTGNDENDILLPEGVKCLIVCRVVIGRALAISNNNHDLVAPPEGFDTTCNEAILDKNTGEVRIPAECIYSIYQDSRIYPEYIVYIYPIAPFRNFFKAASGTSNTTLVYNQAPTKVVIASTSSSGAVTGAMVSAAASTSNAATAAAAVVVTAPSPPVSPSAVSSGVQNPLSATTVQQSVTMQQLAVTTSDQSNSPSTAQDNSTSPPPVYPFSHLSGPTFYAPLPPLWPEMEAFLMSIGHHRLRGFGNNNNNKPQSSQQP